MNSSTPEETAEGSGEVPVLVTLQRGLEALECIAGGNGTITAKMISRRLDINLSTTYHILRTLRASGHVVRLKGGLLDVGPASMGLSRRLFLRSGPTPEQSALLLRLHNKTRETSYVSSWHQGTVILQQYIAGSHALSVGNLDVGYSADLHARASAKAVLAFLPERQVELMFSGVEMRQLTANTCHSYEEMVTILATVRREGYAIDNEEFAEDISCVSVPFFDSDGSPLGSYTVSSPTSRFAVSRTRLIAETREVAFKATEHFRSSGPRS
ncbi:MAG: IclR family transcriptional regulator [Aeromicrobium sp.]|nr:IclR family transcriptional regulator [Aeromicrobium sp.]